MHNTRRRALSALAGQVIGYRKDGRPIRLAAGGSGEGDSGGAGSDGADGTGSTDAGGDGQGGKDGQGDSTDSKNPKIEGEFDKDRYERTLAAARAGEQKAKQEAKAERERVAAILKAAGLTPDGKADPAEQLKDALAERDAAAAKARDTAVELAVYKRAGKAGGDPDALLDSRTFRDAVKGLDPTSADFADKVTDAITAAIKANPKLAATVTPGGQGPARQGTDHTGGNNGGRQRPAGLGAAIAARMTGQ